MVRIGTLLIFYDQNVMIFVKM